MPQPVQTPSTTKQKVLISSNATILIIIALVVIIFVLPGARSSASKASASITDAVATTQEAITAPQTPQPKLTIPVEGTSSSTRALQIQMLSQQLDAIYVDLQNVEIKLKLLRDMLILPQE